MDPVLECDAAGARQLDAERLSLRNCGEPRGKDIEPLQKAGKTISTTLCTRGHS